jgi:hypothetical protein
MPYNPGITDQSGMLRAQGTIAQAEGIASGFSGGFKTFQQNKLRNQVLQGENEGLIKAFMSDPETAKYAPEGIDKFLTKVEKGGGLGLDDNIKLNGMLNSALKTKGVIGEQQQRQQAIALQQQQIAESKSQQAQQAFILQREQLMAQQQAAMDQRNQQLAQFGNGVGTGVLKPEAQAAMNAQMKTNPQALLLARALQQTKDPGVIREIIQANAAAAKGNKAGVIESRLPSGALVAESPSTGAFSVLPPSPQQAAAIEGAKAEAEMNSKNSASFLTGISDAAESARSTIGTVDRVLSLYDQGVQSGFGQPTLTQARAALARLGLGGGDIGNQQQFEKELNNLVLERGKELMKGWWQRFQLRARGRCECVRESESNTASQPSNPDGDEEYRGAVGETG